VAHPARIYDYWLDNDPIVLLHAGALLTCPPPGRCAYIEADVRDPDRVLTGLPTYTALARKPS
jgi:hypothetical protein